jgi:hypothetical protein
MASAFQFADDREPGLRSEDNNRAKLLSPILPHADSWQPHGQPVKGEPDALQLQSIQIDRVLRYRQVSEARVRRRQSDKPGQDRAASSVREPKVILDFHRVNAREFSYDLEPAAHHSPQF